MFRRRNSRITTSWLLAFSLLFSQLALASYVCPQPHRVADMSAMEMASGLPCEGMAVNIPMDKSQPLLCHQHSVDAPQFFDPVSTPTVSLPAVVQEFVVPLLPVSESDDATAFHDRIEPARPPPDPLFLSTLRLRV